jgi:hypothetical protein
LQPPSKSSQGLYHLYWYNCIQYIRVSSSGTTKVCSLNSIVPRLM